MKHSTVDQYAINIRPRLADIFDIDLGATRLGQYRQCPSTLVSYFHHSTTGYADSDISSVKYCIMQPRMLYIYIYIY